MRSYSIFSLSAAITIALDQATKYWVMAYLPDNHAIPIIPGVFDLVNIRNRGAAFGILNRNDIEWQFWLFLAATFVAVCIIFMLLRKYKEEKIFACGLGLIFGGAIGNLIDRLRFRAVVDFLDFYWRDWHWPAFNVADAGICIGCFFVCFTLWRQKPEKKA